jgi:SAM-dependent methyltransferase
MAAKWLMKRGFDVTLVDGSTEMIQRAKATLGRVSPKKATFTCEDVRQMDRYLERSSFNLVIANALLVHIAPKHAAELISKIYDVLKPGGHFFFNLKIRDHTLVSLDGRYFAYYPDITSPRSMLRVAGFEVDEIALRENHMTCYGVPKDIHWANFYCRKPE